MAPMMTPAICAPMTIQFHPPGNDCAGTPPTVVAVSRFSPGRALGTGQGPAFAAVRRHPADGYRERCEPAAFRSLADPDLRLNRVRQDVFGQAGWRAPWFTSAFGR